MPIRAELGPSDEHEERRRPSGTRRRRRPPRARRSRRASPSTRPRASSRRRRTSRTSSRRLRALSAPDDEPLPPLAAGRCVRRARVDLLDERILAREAGERDELPRDRRRPGVARERHPSGRRSALRCRRVTGGSARPPSVGVDAVAAAGGGGAAASGPLSIFSVRGPWKAMIAEQQDEADDRDLLLLRRLRLLEVGRALARHRYGVVAGAAGGVVGAARSWRASSIPARSAGAAGGAAVASVPAPNTNAFELQRRADATGSGSRSRRT